MESSCLPKSLSAGDARLYLGIDVQAASRGCPYAVLDGAGESVEAGWVAGSARRVVGTVAELVERLIDTGGAALAVGIDAPRMRLPSPRQWYWEGPRVCWRSKRPTDLGNGRHCEVVIAAHGLANPQWTPHRPPFPDWMRLGFALFKTLEKRATVYEVFPSASYALLKNSNTLNISVQLNAFAQGPKDVLDAYVAAATVREYVQGRGCAVGGGDGLGEIVIPGPLPTPNDAVLQWPGAVTANGVRRAPKQRDTAGRTAA